MQFAADLHVHTVSSGHAYSTLEEYIQQAKKIGLPAFAMTDHGPAMPGGPHYYHFANLRLVPPTIDGIRIYRGVEANIIDADGRIDLTEADLKWGGLEVVIVALHPRCGYEDQGERKNTDVLIKALQNRHINIIAHPGNPKYPINIEAIVAEAKQRRVLIELNNSSAFSRPGSEQLCLQIAQEVKKQGWQVALGTDSHLSLMLGNFDNSLELIRQAELTEENIVNTSLNKIESFLART